MTLYSTSDRSADHADSNKQPEQDPPMYSPLPSPTVAYRDDPHSTEPQLPPPPPPPPTEEIRERPTMGERFHRLTAKAGWPLNRAANLIGSEGWWPTTMDKECAKAARILHSFTALTPDDADLPTSNAPMHPTGLTRKSMKKIPPGVLQSCAGLAIFNVLRAGACHNSLAAGSGVVVSRRPDGTWSPPSAFVITTFGTGFVFGLDVYDCVCVLNSPEQVEAFTNTRFSLGAEGSLALGPVGTGRHVEAALSKTARPVWSYMKSRGFWVGVQIDGTIVVSRPEANGIFYNERGITPRKILLEDVAWPAAGKPLFDILRAIEGQNFDPVEVRTDPTSLAYAIPEGDQPQQQRDPDVKSFEMVNKEDQYETPEEEKERLAKSGY